MKTKTLTQLRDALLEWDDSAKRAEVDAFDMASWLDDEYGDQDTDTECGTACCAGGLAALLGISGLSLDARNDIYHKTTETVGWTAVRTAFGLTHEDARSIFLEDGYPQEYLITPAMVAEKIEELLKAAKEDE